MWLKSNKMIWNFFIVLILFVSLSQEVYFAHIFDSNHYFILFTISTVLLCAMFSSFALIFSIKNYRWLLKLLAGAWAYPVMLPSVRLPLLFRHLWWLCHVNYIVQTVPIELHQYESNYIIIIIIIVIVMVNYSFFSGFLGFFFFSNRP